MREELPAGPALVIPTYRILDVGATAKAYRQHFDRYGHDIPIIIFDDSSLEQSQAGLPRLRSLCLTNTFYVGPEEKARFLDVLVARTNPKDEPHIRHFLRPSYGGNRNWTLLGTLGTRAITVDDDMVPYGLFHNERASLHKKEVLKGMFVGKDEVSSETHREEVDLYAAFMSVLGRKVGEIERSTYAYGKTTVDSMNDPYFNTSIIQVATGVANTVTLTPGFVNPNAKIVVAQTPKTGWADLDAVDFAKDCLAARDLEGRLDTSYRYVLQAYRPFITSENWRLDTGVLAYDNTGGLPPFVPTMLRTEEFTYRILVQHPEFAAAHVGAVQTHMHHATGRQTIGMDIWNESIANYLREKWRRLTRNIHPTHIEFERDGFVSREDAGRLMHVGTNYFQKFWTTGHERLREQPHNEDQGVFYLSAADEIMYCYFDFDFQRFHREMQRIVVQELNATIDTMRIWPSVLEETKKLTRKGEFRMRNL